MVPVYVIHNELQGFDPSMYNDIDGQQVWGRHGTQMWDLVHFAVSRLAEHDTRTYTG